MSLTALLRSIVTFGADDLPLAPRPANDVTLAAPGPAEQLEIAAQLIPSWQVGRLSWPAWDASRASEGARKLALIFRCLSVLAYTLGTAPIRVYDEAKNNETIPDHPMRRLMRRPNPHMDEASFWSHVGLRTATYGFCVVEKERDRLGNVIGLWPLRSAWLKAIARSDGAYDWEYRIPGLAPIRNGLEAENVIVFRWADTSDSSPYGMGPLEAAFREISLLNVLLDFVKAHVERGAVPVYGLVPEMQIGNQPVRPKTQAEIDAMIDQFVARHGGLDKANRPIYLQAIKEIVKIGANLEEMAFTSLRDVSELAICTAFGVPPRKVGVRVGLEHTTQNATAKVEDAEFYKGTIIPLWTRFDGALTLGLLSEFEPPGSTRSLEFDLSDIDALQEDRNAKWDRVNAAVAAGWMSVKTAHAELGIPFVGKRDYFLRSIAVEAVPVDDPFGGSAPHGDDDGQGALARGRLPLALAATTRGAGPARRLASARHARRLIRKVADAREPSIRAFFRAQGERLVPTVLEGLAAAEHAKPITTLAMKDVDWEAERTALERVLRQLYALAGETAYDAINDELGVSIAFDLANPKLKAVRDLLADRVTAITDESRNSIRDVVTRGGEQGKTIDEIAADLRALFDGWTRGRAQAVARTESMSSFGYASAAGYRESGVVDRIQCFDNPDHDEPYGAEDGLSCAQRNGLIAPLEDAEKHIRSEHPNGTLAIAGVLIGEE